MSPDNYAICLLAGGLARRMGGGDKGEIEIAGQTVLSGLIDRFSDAPYLFLNANGDGARFAHYGLDVVPDILPDHQGPLSGIYAAMAHLRAHHSDVSWLVVLPTDAPLLPEALAGDMLKVAQDNAALLVSVSSKGRNHPVIGLWSLSVFERLQHALIEEGVRKIDAFTAAIGCHYIAYDTQEDPFVNLNRPEDLAAYRNSLATK